MPFVRIGAITGLAGGALDFVAAPTIYPAAYPGLAFSRIWQSVAEGVLGEASYEGGRATVALGIGLHFFIALCAGMVLAFAMSRAEVFRRVWFVSGAVYGVAMYYFMQKIVLPLSLIGERQQDLKSTAIGLAIHIFIFGLGSAFIAARLLKGKTHASS
ncbi:MAG: hypothetical protein HXY21_10415 [Parvularculaceae bacterium]|nr:hypothetical protein [Parvularculaceae bacterium]